MYDIAEAKITLVRPVVSAAAIGWPNNLPAGSDSVRLVDAERCNDTVLHDLAQTPARRTNQPISARSDHATTAATGAWRVLGHYSQHASRRSGAPEWGGSAGRTATERERERSCVPSLVGRSDSEGIMGVVNLGTCRLRSEGAQQIAVARRIGTPT